MSDLSEKELARRRELAWQMAETVMATVKEEDCGDEYELMATVRPVYLRDDNDAFEVAVCKKPEGEDEFRMSSYSLATVRAPSAKWWRPRTRAASRTHGTRT